MTSLALATLLAATLLSPTALSVDAAESTLRFHIVHTFHRVDGESSTLEGKAVTQKDGRVLVMVRVPVSSFQLGDANRDAHMREVLEVGKYPFVVFKGVARLGPRGELPSGPLTMEGELDFHGVKRVVTVPLSLQSGADGTLRVRGAFDISLDTHGIERPSLLFVKLNDTCRIEVDLLLRQEK